MSLGVSSFSEAYRFFRSRLIRLLFMLEMCVVSSDVARVVACFASPGRIVGAAFVCVGPVGDSNARFSNRNAVPPRFAPVPSHFGGHGMLDFSAHGGLMRLWLMLDHLVVNSYGPPEGRVVARWRGGHGVRFARGGA
jgi:hypothetical protein